MQTWWGRQSLLMLMKCIGLTPLSWNVSASRHLALCHVQFHRKLASPAVEQVPTSLHTQDACDTLRLWGRIGFGASTEDWTRDLLFTRQMLWPLSYKGKRNKTLLIPDDNRSCGVVIVNIDAIMHTHEVSHVHDTTTFSSLNRGLNSGPSVYKTDALATEL